jgi:hypothetical protein
MSAKKEAAPKAAAAAKPSADKGHFSAIHGGPMIDPTNGVVFDGNGKEAARTEWVAFQIEHGKLIEAVTPEAPAEEEAK